MTWWIAIYLGLFAVLSAGGLWDDYRDRRPPWVLVCAAGSNLTLVYLFVAFWQASLRTPLGSVAPLAYVAAMWWELFQAVRDIRRLRADSELSETQRQRFAIAIAFTLLAFCLPVFILAGVSAFKA